MQRLFLFAVLFASLTIPISAHSLGRMADIRIIDRQLQRELPIHWFQGKAYVEGQPGNEYQIRIHNREGTDVLAVVSVDGVNVVTGETAAPSQGGYVLDSGRQLDVAGWRTSLADTAAFYFTTLADSYATRTGRPSNVGVIGAALFRRKEAVVIAPFESLLGNAAPMRREKAAADSSVPSSAESASAAPAPAAPQAKALADSRVQERVGTGYGRREDSAARRVTFERRTSLPEEVITIFYDSRANLIARGIIREPIARPHIPTPTPFPGGFVPAPPM